MGKCIGRGNLVAFYVFLVVAFIYATLSAILCLVGYTRNAI